MADVTESIKFALIIGLRVSQESERVPILQYVDDTILFLDDDIQMVENLKEIVFWFGEVSGLVVNEAKLKIFPIADATKLTQATVVWDYEATNLPDKYLGAPLAVGCKCKHAWQDLVERFRD